MEGGAGHNSREFLCFGIVKTEEEERGSRGVRSSVRCTVGQKVDLKGSKTCRKVEMARASVSGGSGST